MLRDPHTGRAPHRQGIKPRAPFPSEMQHWNICHSSDETEVARILLTDWETCLFCAARSISYRLRSQLLWPGMKCRLETRRALTAWHTTMKPPPDSSEPIAAMQFKLFECHIYTEATTGVRHLIWRATIGSQGRHQDLSRSM